MAKKKQSSIVGNSILIIIIALCVFRHFEKKSEKEPDKVEKTEKRAIVEKKTDKKLEKKVVDKPKKDDGFSSNYGKFSSHDDGL